MNGVREKSCDPWYRGTGAVVMTMALWWGGGTREGRRRGDGIVVHGWRWDGWALGGKDVETA